MQEELKAKVEWGRVVGARFLVAMTIFGLTVGVAFFMLGRMHGQNLATAATVLDAQDYQSQVKAQQKHLVGLQAKLELTLNGVTRRLGQLQAQMLRLNALGEQLAETNSLDEADFDFTTEVPRGGLELQAEPVMLNDLGSLQDQIEMLSSQMKERRWQFDVMQSVLISDSLSQEFLPRGKPVRKGWLSSRYGWRNDPFSGRKAFHHGLDFAGKKGGDVVAVAAGLVVKAERHSGYGLLVEIDHGAGYITRYGHSQRALVKVGDIVARGDVIAEIGSSGRSTGPHVHFEVWHNGKSVNPYKFVVSAD